MVGVASAWWWSSISSSEVIEPVAAHTLAPVADLRTGFDVDLPPSVKAEVLRGQYVARLGVCVACHTADPQKPMAGGRALETPFGPLFSTNITPDPETGIGQYTFAQFDRAMRQGVTANGQHLYPAMPYPSYAKMSDSDMQALYTYLMKGIAPVKQTNAPLALSFPFNQRWGLAFWNFFFLDDAPFQPVATATQEWNRGAYIVQGLGHCGACHTPRGFAFQEKALTDQGGSGNLFLAGETVEHWRALSLRNLWTVEDTVQLLKTGANQHGTVSGNMVDVIQHSTQHMSDADLRAVAVYLKSLPPGPDDKPMVMANTHHNGAAIVPKGLYDTRGGLTYLQFCIDCHRANGDGAPNVFPPLAGNPSLQSPEPSTLIHIMLTGATSPQTETHPRPWVMPSFAQLGDDEIANVLNFARHSWGRPGADIQASDVAKMRKALKTGSGGVQRFETPRLADMLQEPNAEQLVYGARLNIETRTLLPKNVGNALNCTSCHMNAGTVADGSPYVGVSAFFPSYAPRAGKMINLEDRINGCFNRSMNGSPLPLESAELKAMVAYFDWMKRETKPDDKVEGRGIGKIDRSIQPNLTNGKKIYAMQCAACHGANGEGVKSAQGEWIYPPLWGSESFNLGAGMARTYTAAAFVKRNMPIAHRQQFPLGQGGLSDQEAVDVAAYFSQQPRPDFAGKVKDWPKGGKPSDARY